MSKKKMKTHHKSNTKPCVNHRTVYMIAVEERMQRILHRMQEAVTDPRPLDLARDAAAHLCEETCKLRMFASDQAEEE